MDLFDLSRTISLRENYYALIIVDDYSRFIWELFITSKNDVFTTFKKLVKLFQIRNNCYISSIRSDHGSKFQTKKFNFFCEKYGIRQFF